MRIVHTADIHLRGDREERWGALSAVIDAAAEADAGVLVITGDLFDRDFDATPLKARLRPVLERFAGRVVVLPGNHDAAGIRAGDFFGRNVSVLAGTDVVTDIDGVRFVGVPFEDVSIDGTLARLRAASRQRGDGASVLLYHGELLDLSPGSGAFGEEDDREYMPARLGDLADLGFDYVLAGHFHKNHDVRACGRGFFTYSGSPVSITRRETGPRHIGVIDVGQAPVGHTLATRHYAALDIRLSPADDEHPVARIERELSALAPGAVALVEIHGYVDLSLLNMNESEFHARIAETVARFDVEACSASACSDVSTILSGDLFRRFSARLAHSTLGEADRALVREMAIRAMMEVPDAR
ncbi:MAG TPA: metallophosphoesterase [Candidatus Krumholzibacteria bacterium]|nr:metallophosphoesterase [Candidatus Krumholzibacteria bacterium]